MGVCIQQMNTGAKPVASAAYYQKLLETDDNAPVSKIFRLDPPMPIKSKAWRWLDEGLKRESKFFGFGCRPHMPKRDITPNAPYVVSKIVIESAPPQAIGVVQLLIDEAAMEWQRNHAIMSWNEYFAMELPKRIVEDAEERDRQKKPLRDMLREFRPTSRRDTMNMCAGCSGFAGDFSLKERVALWKLENNSTRIRYAIRGCMSASKLTGKAERRIQEMISDYIHGGKVEETLGMHEGTLAHEILELRRNPTRDITELFRKLLLGGWVAWVLPICDPSAPKRAITPDIVYSKLEKTGNGYHLIHMVGEDKHANRMDYWRQVDAEAMMMQYQHWLVHSNVIKAEFHKTPGVPFNSLLAQKLGVEFPETIHTDIYRFINLYNDWHNPSDPYHEHIMNGKPLPEGTEPPAHWSRDGKTDPVNLENERWVRKAKKERDDALYAAWQDELNKISPQDIEMYMLKHPSEPKDEINTVGGVLNFFGPRMREILRETETTN